MHCSRSNCYTVGGFYFLNFTIPPSHRGGGNTKNDKIRRGRDKSRPNGYYYCVIKLSFIYRTLQLTLRDQCNLPIEHTIFIKRNAILDAERGQERNSFTMMGFLHFFFFFLLSSRNEQLFVRKSCSQSSTLFCVSFG